MRQINKKKKKQKQKCTYFIMSRTLKKKQKENKTKLNNIKSKQYNTIKIILYYKNLMSLIIEFCVFFLI